MVGEVITPHAVVTVDGVARKAKSVRVTRELATDMPDAVAAGGGMVAATASVEWADDRNGISDPRAEIAKPNARVMIEAGVAGAGGALFRRFTGKLDRSSGSAADQSNSSALVDDTSLLNKTVTTPTHFAQEVSGTGISWVGLGTPWMAYEVARQCGMSAYHWTSRTITWASLAGSTLAGIGPNPGYGSTNSNEAWNPVVNPAGVGVGIDLNPGNQIEYAMSPPGSGTGRALEASIWTDPWQAGKGALRLARWEAATGQVGPVLIFGDGIVWVAWQSGSTVTNLSPNSYAAAGWQPLAMHLTWGSVGWEVRLRIGSNVHGPWSVPVTGGAYTAAQTEKWATMVYAYSTSTAPHTVAGLVVDKIEDVTPRWAEHTYSPLFTYEPYLNQLLTWLVAPPQDARQGLDLLREMSQAEMAGLWVDEYGVLRYRTRVPLRGAAVTKTVTSLDSLLDYSWSYSLDALRKRVIVKWRRPVYSIRSGYTLPVWDSGDQTWKFSDPQWQQFVEPGADEDWLDVSFSFTRGADGQRNTSSWWRMQVKDDATNNVIRDANTTDRTLTTALLDGAKSRFLLTVDALGALGASNYIAGKLVLQARGKATWTDETTYSTASLSNGVPSDAPDLVHDVGWMMQSKGQAQVAADFLAGLLAVPVVEVDNVQIVPDPSIRLGDKVRLQDSHVKGWQVEGVVSRIDESWADGDASMTLGLRVTAFKPDFQVTLAQFDARWAGLHLAGLDTHWSGKTLGQLDAAPLT